jgi:PAS domain S-box-containing protein
MKIARNPHFWLILTLFVICCVSHYAEQIGIISLVDPKIIFGLNRQAIVRIFFLVPMIYAGVFFGIVGGITACSLALVAMLPRAIFFSPAPIDALLESTGVVFIGVVVCLCLWIIGKQKLKTQMALNELQSAHKILQHLAQVAKGHERRLNLLNAISSMLLRGTLELEGILRKSTYMVSELMEVEVTLLFLVDEESKELKLAAHEGVSEEFAKFICGTPIGEGIYGEAAETGRPVIVEATSHDLIQANSEFKKMQIRVQLIVPLILREEVHGLICVAMRRPRQFTDDDIELLSAVGTQVAAAVEGARLYERERLLVQHLTIAERNCRRLFENASDAIWMLDLTGDITNANKAAEKLTGYNVEELMGMKARDLFSDESLYLAGQVRRKLFQGEPVEQPYEQHLIKKDGTKTVLMLTTTLITDEGKPIGFQHMARDVSRERWMQENMRHYLQQITRAQEDERKRIARDLHDDTAQALFALTRQVDNFIRSGKNLPPQCHAFMKGLSEQIREVLQRVRRFSQDLRPSILDDLGLIATLRWLIKQLQETSEIEAELKVIGNERRLLAHTELMLFRIVQESLKNVEKHAQASKVELKVVFSEREIMLSINDNGKGFDLAGDLGDLPRVGRLGLAGMEERAHLIGGSLQIDTKLDKGTMVILNAPI